MMRRGIIGLDLVRGVALATCLWQSPAVRATVAESGIRMPVLVDEGDRADSPNRLLDGRLRLLDVEGVEPGLVPLPVPRVVRREHPHEHEEQHTVDHAEDADRHAGDHLAERRALALHQDPDPEDASAGPDEQRGGREREEDREQPSSDEGRTRVHEALQQVADGLGFESLEGVLVVFKDGWHPAEVVSEGAGRTEWQWTKKEATLAFRSETFVVPP